MVQRSSPSKQKYSRPRLVLDGSGTRSGDQFLKFWTRPTLDVGLVDVDPVIGKRLGPVDDQDDGEEVAVLERLGGLDRPRAGPAGSWPGSARGSAGSRGSAGPGSGSAARRESRATNAVTADPSCSIRTTRRSRWTAPPCSRIRSRAASHIWPGPSRGYWKLSIRVLITSPLALRPAAEEGVRRPRRTRLRPLIRCAAQSAEIVVRRHPPDLLGVGLEEDLEEERGRSG